MAVASTAAPKKRNSPLKRRFRKFLFLVIPLLLVLWLAPLIVASTTLRHWVAQRIFSEVRGTIHIGNASLGWFSHIVLRDVKVTDPDGAVFLTIPKVESSHTLIRLLGDLSDLGLFRCERPKLRVVFAGKASNVEKALAGYLHPEQEASQHVAVELDVIEAAVHIEDRDSRRKWHLAPVDVAVKYHPGRAAAVEFTMDGVWHESKQKVVAQIVITSGDRQSDKPARKVRAVIDVKDFPLSLCSPLLRRYDAGANLDGRLTARLSGSWRDGPAGTQAADLDGIISITNLNATGGWLGTDQLRLTQLRLPCRIGLRGREIDIGHAALECDFGKAALKGRFATTGGWTALLAQPNCRATGEIDLARLTAVLPQTLRMQNGARLTDGTVTFSLQSSRQQRGVVWTGQLHTSRLEGVNQKKVFSWPGPLSLDFQARWNKDGMPLLEQLQCRSSFVNAHLTGFNRQWTLSANYDLDKLSQQLSQFVDLGSFHFTGKGSTSVTAIPGDAGEYQFLGSSSFNAVNIGTSAVPLAGKLQANVFLRSNAGEFDVDMNLTAKQFIAGDTSNPYWYEPELRLLGKARYRETDDALDINKLAIESAAFRLDTHGKLRQLLDKQELTLQGKVHYDLEKLGPMLRLYFGRGVKLYGKGTGPLRLSGSLATTKSTTGNSDLQGSAAVRWTAADIYGFRCGAADVHAELSGGWLRGKPIHTSVNKGKLSLQPMLRLDRYPVELRLTEGKAVERAKITPAMSKGAIKYALPVLADMTQGEGEISLDLSGARIPLDDPTKADIAGWFTIHHAQVVATPLIRELAVLLKVPSGVSLAKQSVVPFRMVEGKVWHENLALVFPDLTVRTRGWVGLDGSLNLAAEFPIPPKWVGANKIGKALAEQKITVPIGGTLEQPRLDKRALQAAVQQFLKNATQNLIQQELEDRLNKLFAPK